MSLTFKRVDEIFKEYGLKSHMLRDGKRTEYTFSDSESMTGKKNVAANVMNNKWRSTRLYLCGIP